jgi:hypothetical protein
VRVHADEVTCRTWTEDAPGHRARSQVELKAYDVALRCRSRTPSPSGCPALRPRRPGADSDGTDPWADGGQVAATAEIPEVLAGVIR